MVLVDADAVEAELVGFLELVQVLVVDLMAAHGVVQLSRGQVDPDAVVALPEVVGQVWVRHQVEEVKFHLRASRNRSIASETAAVCSSGTPVCSAKAASQAPPSS